MTERSNQPHRQRPPDVEEALSSMLWTPYERTPTDSSSEDDVDRLDKQLSLQHRKRRKSQSGFEQRAAASYVAIDGSYFGIDDLCSVRTPIAPYHPTLPTAAAATTFQQQPIITTTTTPQPPFVPFPNLSLSRAATAGHNELLLPATISAASSDYHKHYESSVCYNRSSYPSYGPIPSLTKWWSSGATASSSIKEPPSYESLYTKKGNSSTDTMRPMLDSLKAGGLHSVNIEQHEAENSCDRSNRSPTVLNTTTTITTTDNVPSERLVHSFTDDFISLNCTSSATLATSTTMFQQQTAMQHVPTNVDKPHAVERDRKCNKVNENAKINETGQEEKREETATNGRSQQKIENINNNNNNSEHVSCIMNEHKNNHHCCASNNNDECNSEVKEPTTTTIEERATEETETNSLVVQVNQPVYCATPIREHCVTTTTTTATATTTTATLNPIMNTPTNSPTISTTVAAANMARSCDKSTLTDNSSVNFQQSNAEPLLLTEEHLCDKSGWSTVESERASERAIIRADSFKAYTSARKRSSATSSFYRGDRQTNFYTSDNLTPNKCLAELERLYAEFRASESIYERKLKAQSEIGAGTVAVADVQTATMRLNIPASFADAAASSVVVATTAAPATTCSSVFLGATTTATNVHSSSGSSNSNNNNNNCNNNNDNDNNTVENGLSSARSVSNISILPATKSCQRQASLTIQVNNSNDNDNNNNNNNNNNHVGNNGRSVSIAMPTTNQIAINQQQQQQKQLTSTTVHNSNNNSNENISVVNCNYVQANNINSNGNSNLKNNPYKSNRLTEKATSVVEVSAATVAPSLVDGVHIINTHVSSPVPKVLKASSVENDNVRVANAFSENHNSNNNNTTTTTTTSDTSACAESVNIINVNTITTNHITTATTTAPSTAATTTSTSAITAVTPSHMSQVPTRTFTSIECQTDDIATTSTQLRSGAGGGDGGGSGGGTGAGGSTGVSGSSISNNAANREQRRRERRERRQQQQHQQQQQALTNPIGPSARRHPSDRHSLHAPTHPTALSHLHPPLHHHHLSTGAIMRPMLPDILHHSHYPPPYSALPGSGIHPTLPAPPSLLGPPSGPPPPPQAPHPPVAPPGATLLAPVVATCALPGTAALLADGRFSLPLPIMRRSPSERSGKGCCGQWFAGPPLRALIAVVAFGGFACALGGVALGATGLAGPPASHLTAALLMIGVGVVLVTVSGAAWRMTAPGGQTCLGLGSSVDLGRCGRRPCSRGGGTPHGLLYPEFQHRPPPPSYQASMQEYRLRLLLLDRDRQNGVVRGNSPPPTYRSHAGSLLRAPLTTLRGSSIGGSEYSLPPSYRSRHGTPSTVCSERTIETAPSGRLLANEDIPEPSGAEQLLPDYCSLQANTLLTSAIVEIETSNHNRNDSESATECQRAMTTTATTASKTNATNIKDNSQTAKAKDLVTIVTISQSNVDATNGARMNSTTTDQIDILAHL